MLIECVAERSHHPKDTIDSWELGRDHQGDGWLRSRTLCKRSGFGLELLILPRMQLELTMMLLGPYVELMRAPTLNYLSQLQIRMATASLWITFSLSHLRKSGTASDADGFVGALKAKLLDGKGLRVLSLANSVGLQSSVASNSPNNNNNVSRESGPITVAAQEIGNMNPVQGPVNPGSSKPDLVLNHDHELDDQVVAGQIGVQWPQPGQNQTASMASMIWSNEPSLEAAWGTQMNQVLSNGLFNIITSTTASSSWPLPRITESTMALSYSDQCPIELQMNMNGKTNMVSMPISQIDGTTEGVWPSEQQFVHCDNNGWSGANGFWDPYLYVSSVLD
ncbi:hypothetical protein CRYUN_Cryun13aG0098800 [Craigia yunnanensis]